MYERTCVACRQTDDCCRLLRFVKHRFVKHDEPNPSEKDARVTGWGVELEVEVKLPGRGAYCHISRTCLRHPGLGQLILMSLKRVRRNKIRRSEKKNLLLKDEARYVGAESGNELSVAVDIKQLVSKAKFELLANLSEAKPSKKISSILSRLTEAESILAEQGTELKKNRKIRVRF